MKMTTTSMTETATTVTAFGVTIARVDMKLKTAAHVATAIQTMGEKIHFALSKRDERILPVAPAVPQLATTTVSSATPTNFGTNPAPVPNLQATPNPFVPSAPPETLRIEPISPPVPPPPPAALAGANDAGDPNEETSTVTTEGAKRRCPDYPSCSRGRHTDEHLSVCLYWNWVRFRPPSHVPVRSSKSVSLERLNRETWPQYKPTWTFKESVQMDE